MIFVELLEKLSIEWQMVVGIASTKEPSWLDANIAFLFDGSLPTDGKKAKKVQRMSA